MAARAKAKTKKTDSGRKRKAETKDETVEVSTGVQLLLGNLPSDKDAKYQYETLMSLLEKSASAASRVGAHKKKMREAGFDVDAFMRTMRLERMDPLDLGAHMKEMARLARLRGLPVQMSIFETKYDSVEEQAAAEGFNAGAAGRTPDTARWVEGQPGYDAYMAAWTKGQKSVIESGVSADEDED